MLKKILTTPWTSLLTLAFFICLPRIVNAQFRYDYPIVCDNTQKVIKVLEEDFKEQLSWKGSHASDNSKYSLWVNEKTRSWTLLKMTPEFTCILGVGDESNSLFGIAI
jgi:hypothetical protein